MTLSLILLLAFGVSAVMVAAMALVSILQRRDLLKRAGSESAEMTTSSVLLPEKGRDRRIQAYLERLADSEKDNPASQMKLIQAGFESATGPAVLWILRVMSVFAFPLLAILIVPKSPAFVFFSTLAIAVFVGFLLPIAMLDRLVRLRQQRIRRSVPDALDLLVVCVEAGISLDAAVLRVSRELRLLHRDLADELAVVNRVTNAGIPREMAMRGLFERTGVDELRTLASSLVQSEKWGTSIATVLRVNSDTLRRKRRQSAEKRAKMAPVKMTFPLLLLILPPLFVLVMGPVLIKAISELKKV